MKPLRIFSALLVAASLLGFGTGPSFSDYRSSATWFERQTVNGREQVQRYLAITGYYNGFIDGAFGRQTYNAIIGFERANRFRADGVLTDFEFNQLWEAYNLWFPTFGFQQEYDPRSGFRGPIPTAIFTKHVDTDAGRIWADEDEDFLLETMTFDGDVRLRNLFGIVLSDPDHIIEYDHLNEDHFVVSGRTGKNRFYVFMRQQGRFNSGLRLEWSSAHHDIAQPIISYVASEARFSAPTVRIGPQGGVDPGDDRNDGNGNAPSNVVVAPPSTGSGFFVSTAGLIVTNNHVVDGCERLAVPGYGDAEVLRRSPELDLAAIWVQARAPVVTAIFADEPPKLGESVIGGGYPLSDIMGNDFKVTFGNVTGRRGLNGSTALFSVSAPVQPGNSGGPIVNEDGHVIGVIVSKLDEVVMLQIHGSSGANFNFAIDAQLAMEFLEPFVIDERNPLRESHDDLEAQNVVRNMERYTVQILCNHRPGGDVGVARN